MSRAFVKEDVDVPERATRRRSSSGLPPGALNYMSARGAARWREKIAQMLRAGKHADAREAEQILASATIVELPETPLDAVILGTRVTLRTKAGELKTVRVVGVDEVEFHADAVSWVSPEGRALLGAECGQRVPSGGGEGGSTETVIKIESPED